MALIEVAGRRVGQEISTGAGHLALFYTDDAGGEFVLSAYASSIFLTGTLSVELFEGSAWVPREFSTENAINPDYFDTVPIDFETRDPNAVAMLIDQFALELNDEDLDYSVVDQNSNSVIGSILRLVGIDVDDVLPNPSGVGFLGFVARNDLIDFEYEIVGSVTDDYIQGGDLAQTFLGGAGNDTLIGGRSNDTLEGNQGDDRIVGGSGTDTAFFDGDQSSYTLTLSRSETTLVDRRADGNGTDTLVDVEMLDFDTEVLGGPLDLNLFGGLVALDAPALESFIELYIAYYNRAPDALGLNFWGTTFANGLTLEQMATEFIDQDETDRNYPEGTPNNVFATRVYENVLGRAADQAGLDFWIAQLDSGDVGKDQFILEVLRGAKSDPKPELGQAFVDQQLADKAYLENKTDLGAYFAVHKGLSDQPDAVAAMALYDGSQQSFDNAIAAIDGFYDAALDPQSGAFLMPLVGILDDPFFV